jgi:hypothetical protein
LIQLGAEIQDCLTEKITHYICSNVNHKKMIAAKLLNINVLKPEWIDECRQTQSKIPEHSQNFSYSATISFQDFIKDNPELFAKSSTVAAASSSSSSSAPLPPPVNIPLPSFKEYQMPELPETKITRRRSERLCDLQDEESSDSDDSIPNQHHQTTSTTTATTTATNKKTKNLKKKVSKHPEFIQNSSLQDTMNISTKEILPIAYGNESPDEIIANWKANLATDLVLDGNGPSAERKSGFFLKKQPNYAQRQQRKNQSAPSSLPLDSPKKRGRPKSTRRGGRSAADDEEEEDEEEEEEQDDNDDDSSTSMEISELRTTSRNSNNTNPSTRRGRRGGGAEGDEQPHRRGRRQQPSQPPRQSQRSSSRRSNDSLSMEVLSSDSMAPTEERSRRRGRPKRSHSESSEEEYRERVVTLTQKQGRSQKNNSKQQQTQINSRTNNKQPVIAAASSSSGKQSKQNNRVIIALTGFNKRDGDLQTMQKVIQSFLQTIQSNFHHDDIPLPLPSLPISEKDRNSPFFIQPFEQNVQVLEDDSSYELPFTHVIVSKNNNS